VEAGNVITVKEEFLTDDKTQRAIKAGGYEVLALWLAMKRYCAEHLTDGFVPDEDIDSLPGAPPKPRKLLPALVECGRKMKDGGRGPGLVIQLEHGWELHKYLEHANSSEQEKRRKELAKERKDRWLERRSESVPNSAGTASRTGSEPGPPAGGRTRVPTPPHPTPKEEENPPPLFPDEAPDTKDVAALRKAGEKFERSFGKQPDHKREDVLDVHGVWRFEFGRGEAPLVVGSNYDDATTIADRIDASGLADSLLVARYAKFDGMVCGRDDERKTPHESIRYIFGNNDAFTRILRDAKKREAAQASGGSALARQRALKARDADGGGEA
jgi:hypothetical protein